MDCEMLTTNAGGRLAKLDDQSAFMDGITHDHPSWQLLFIAEVDGRLAADDGSPQTNSGCYEHRRVEGVSEFRYPAGPAT